VSKNRGPPGRGSEQVAGSKSMQAGPRSEEVGFAHDSPLEGRRFEPSVPRRIDDAPETARFAFAALPVPPERPTRFATDGSKAENHVATVLDAGGMRILMLGYEQALRTIKELKGDQLNGLAEYQDDFRRMAARGAA
jgi:hypothetical protein